MADGFKIAEGFVEVTAEDNTRTGLGRVNASVSRWGDQLTAKVRQTFSSAFDSGADAAEQRVAALRDKVIADIEQINAKKAKIDLDVLDTQAKLNRLRVELETATADQKVHIEAEIASASANLVVLDRQAKALTSERHDLQVRLDQNQFAAVDAAVGGLTDRLKALKTTPAMISFGVVGAMEALTWIQKVGAGLTSIGALAVASAAVTAGAMVGISDAVEALGEKGPEAAKKTQEAMEKLTPEGQRFATAIRSLIDGELMELRDIAQTGLLPGLQDGIDGFVSSLTGAEASVAGISRNLGQFFRDIGPAAGAATDAFLRLANLGSGPGLTSLADTVNRILGSFTEWANSKSADEIAADIHEIGSTITSLWNIGATAFRGLQLAWEALTFSTEVFRDPIRVALELYDALRKFAEHIPGLKGLLPELSSAVRDYGAASESTAGQTRTLESASRNLAAAQREVEASARSMASTFGGVREAETSYWAAIDATTTALKDNGKTLDVHTEKGRANRTALDGQAQAANAYTEKLREAGAQGPAFNAVVESQRQALIKAATQFGMTKTQATNYANAILGIPKNWETIIKADTAQAMANLNTLKTTIANINGKTVTIRTVNETVYISSGSNTAIARSAGGWVPGQRSTVDTVPAMLAGREFVVRSGPADRWGPALEAINAGASPARVVQSMLGALGSRSNPSDQSGVMGSIRGVSPGRAAVLSPSGAASSTSGGGTHYHFAPGSVILDASKIRDLQGLLDMLDGVRSTARQYGAVPIGA